MVFTKRDLLKAGGLAALGLGAAACVPQAKSKPIATTLKSVTGKAVPISAADHQARTEKAQRLMQERGIGALIIEAGASLRYFTGIQWWRSERLTAAIIPAEGEIAIVTPHFEEPSIRESMKIGDDVRVWHEHENPHGLVAGILKDRGVTSGKVAFEDTVRFFAVDGLKQAAPQYDIVSGGPIVWGCRMFKSAAELALMQLANDVTMAAYRHVIPQVDKGMTPKNISSLMNKATRELGGSPEFSMALTASPVPIHMVPASRKWCKTEISFSWIAGQMCRAINPIFRVHSFTASRPNVRGKCGILSAMAKL